MVDCFDCLHSEETNEDYSKERCFECMKNNFCDYEEVRYVLTVKGCLYAVLCEFNWDLMYDCDDLYKKIMSGIDKYGLRDSIEIALMSVRVTDRERELFYKRFVSILEEKDNLRKDENGHYILRLEADDE